MEHNRFLMEFLRMRKQISAPPEQPKPVKKAERSHTATYKSIIEELPPRADVIEYFKGRIEEIVLENE
jgi:hypothetical protein